MVTVVLISSFLLKNPLSPVFLPFSGGAPDRLGVSLDCMCLFTFHEACVQEQKDTCS